MITVIQLRNLIKLNLTYIVIISLIALIIYPSGVASWIATGPNNHVVSSSVSVSGDVSATCANNNIVSICSSIVPSLVPTGTIHAFAGLIAPSGYILCDGSVVSRSTYSNLFAVIGTTYGIGDGQNTFAIPDLRGRTIVGSGNGVGLTPRVLGETFGSEQHNISIDELPPHSHNVTDPGHIHSAHDTGHTHLTRVPGGSGGSEDGGDEGLVQEWSGVGYAQIVVSSATTSITLEQTGSGSAIYLMQPSIVLNYIIKT